MKPVTIPIEDVLDLHLFRPADIPELLSDYFAECIKANISSVRLIHGKGKGILRKRVHGLLETHPLVESFSTAPPEAGGWGAVIVTLKKKIDNY